LDGGCGGHARSFLILSLYRLGYAGILGITGLNSNSHQFEIVKIVRYGQDKAAFTLRPHAPFLYLAGQYVELSFGNLPARPYSIASAPSQSGDFEIHMKDSGHGGVSTYALTQASVGEIVQGSAAMGQCVYNPHDGDIVLLAGGIGITHLKAIVEEAIAQKHPHNLHLYWSAKQADDLYLQSYFITLKNNYNLLIYNDIIENEISIGGSEFWLKGGVKSPQDSLFYLSGPTAMIEAIVPELMRLGVPDVAIHSDMGDLVQKCLLKSKNSL
jgi:CDP-4-dehydro-6-deoxyglucose reductase